MKKVVPLAWVEQDDDEKSNVRQIQTNGDKKKHKKRKDDLCVQEMHGCAPKGPHDSTKETWCKLVCGCVTQDTSKNVTVLWFSPEHWRSLMYIWFILMLLIDVVVTTVFADMTNIASTMLTRMYGYNNVCLYLDLEPATYFTPFICLCWVLGVTVWALVTEFRNRAAERAGHLNQDTRCCLTACLAIVVFTFAFFITSTAYVPGDGLSELAPLRMILHSIPFALMQVGLVVLSVSETVYGMGGYWARIGTPQWLGAASTAYCALLIGVVCFKLVFYGYSWSVFPSTSKNYTVDGAVIALPANDFAPSTVIVLRLLDGLFLVVAIAIPFGKTLGVLFCKRQHLEKVRVEFSTDFARGQGRGSDDKITHFN